MKRKSDRYFARAEAILEGNENGFGEPILRHLVLRKYGPAMLSLACRNTSSGCADELGRVCDGRSPAALMYRAYRLGERNAAQNFALTLFYVGDLAGYRRWLRKAARSGDVDAMAELKRFQIRQPYPLAKPLRRIRPFRPDGS